MAATSVNHHSSCYYYSQWAMTPLKIIWFENAAIHIFFQLPKKCSSLNWPFFAESKIIRTNTNMNNMYAKLVRKCVMLNFKNIQHVHKKCQQTRRCKGVTVQCCILVVSPAHSTLHSMSYIFWCTAWILTKCWPDLDVGKIYCWWRSELRIKSNSPFSAVLSVPSKHHIAMVVPYLILGNQSWAPGKCSHVTQGLASIMSALGHH